MQQEGLRYVDVELSRMKYEESTGRKMRKMKFIGVINGDPLDLPACPECNGKGYRTTILYEANRRATEETEYEMKSVMKKIKHKVEVGVLGGISSDSEYQSEYKRIFNKHYTRITKELTEEAHSLRLVEKNGTEAVLMCKKCKTSFIRPYATGKLINTGRHVNGRYVSTM